MATLSELKQNFEIMEVIIKSLTLIYFIILYSHIWINPIEYFSHTHYSKQTSAELHI